MTNAEVTSLTPVTNAAKPLTSALPNNVQRQLTPESIVRSQQGAGLGPWGTLNALSQTGAFGKNGLNGQGGITPGGGGGGGGAGGIAGLGSSPMPVMPNITSPVNPGQIQGAQTGVVGSLDASDALLKALNPNGAVNNLNTATGQGQDLYKGIVANNGLGTQKAATGQQGNLNTSLGNANGVGVEQGAVGNLQDVFSKQGQTLGQLSDISQGRGPNPAQTMLNQATGQNVANQAALMAGQRGAGTNVGMIARQAGQQGAGIQQNAAGQAATLEAQQRLGALGQMGGQEQNMGNTGQQIGNLGAGIVGQTQTGIGQLFGQGATTTGQAIGQNATNLGAGNTQVGNVIGATGQNITGNLGNQGQVLGSAGQYNADVTAGTGNVNTNNTNMNIPVIKGKQDVTGGILNGAGPILGGLSGIIGGGSGAAGAAGAGEGAATAANAAPYIAEVGAAAAKGGMIEKSYADGGDVNQPDSGPSVVQAPAPIQQPGPQSSFGRFLTGIGSGMKTNGSTDPLQKGTTNFLTALSKMSKGGMAKDGGPVKAKTPDQKAVKKGNSYDNDKVPAMLSEGEIVIPRSVLQSGDPVHGASQFVAQVLAKRGR
jgi:hypothetical protein